MEKVTHGEEKYTIEEKKSMQNMPKDSKQKHTQIRSMHTY